MTTAITLPLVAIGKAGVDAAVELDKSMRNIQSISKETDAQIASLSDRFVEMSQDMSLTTDTAVNLADAFYQIQGSGFAGEDAMLVLEAATKAATAGLTETAVAAEAIGAVINSYGLEAQDAAHISDLLFETVNRGVGSFEELSSSLSNVVGTASAVGVGFDEVSAAMATMSKQGMSFSEASVSLNQTMLAFLKPSTEMAAVISELGYASGQAMIDALGFGGAMEAVSNHVGGSADAMAGLFGNVRALRGALALTGAGADMFAADLAAMGAVTGATEAAFAEQMKSWDATLKNFRNVWQAFLIEVGQAILPALTQLLGIVSNILKAFNGLPQPVKNFIVGLVAIVAAVGPILLIVGQLLGAITSVKTFFVAFPAVASAVSGAFSAIGAAISAVGLPIIALIALLAALKIAWDNNFLGMKDKIQAIPDVWGKNLEMLGTIVQKLIEKAKTWGGNFIGGFIQGMKQKIAEALKVVIDLAMKVTNGIKNALKIKSPSQVMMGLGEQVVAGFNQGIESFGGIGVQVPALAGAGATVRPSTGSSGGGASGGNVYINSLTVPPGTTQEQIDFIMKEVGRQVKRRGGKG